jgi:hypothetical protein
MMSFSLLLIGNQTLPLSIVYAVMNNRYTAMPHIRMAFNGTFKRLERDQVLTRLNLS